MHACLPCLFFVDYYCPSIEASLFETPSPFKSRQSCFVSVPESTLDSKDSIEESTVAMDLLKRFKRTVKDQSRQSRANRNNNKNNSRNNGDQLKSLGGGGGGQLMNDPARLYYPLDDSRDSDEDDSSGNSNSNSSGISSGTDGSSRHDDADDEASQQSFEASIEASAASLAQSAVSTQSRSSLLVGELAFENMSMVYSEDGENENNISTTSTSEVSNISALSSHQSLDGMMKESTGTGTMKMITSTTNKSSSSAANANGSCTNMLLLQDQHESDDESLLSEMSSLFSPDCYFQPQEEVLVAKSIDNDSDEQGNSSDDYIFTDDSPKSKSPVERLSEAESAALARGASFLQQAQEEEKKEQDDGDSILSPTAWSSYNSARGRNAAKTFMHNLREDDTMQMPFVSQHNYHHRRPSSDQRSAFMLGRAVKSLGRKRYTPSSSPLDYQHPTNDDDDKQEDVGVSKASLLSTLSSETAAALPELAMSTSAVYARNALVDFGSWEARVNRPKITATSAAAGTKVNRPTITSAAAAAAATTTTTTVPTTWTTAMQLPDEEDDSSYSSVEPCAVVTPPTAEKKKVVSNFAIKVTSLFSSVLASPPFVSASQKNEHELDTSALESPRTSANNMLQSLGLAGDDHARQCLQTLRARAGVIDDLECLSDVDDDPSNILPWMHIVDDVWMPHYEEYVFTTVHAFHRRLLVPSGK